MENKYKNMSRKTYANEISCEEIEKYDNDDFDEILDDTEEKIIIWGITFYPSEILKQCDPVAYRCGFNDFQEYENVYTCPQCENKFDDVDDAIDCCFEEEEEEEI